VAETSSAQAIRDYLKDHPDAPPSAVVAALKEQGVEVTATNVSTTKKRMKSAEKPKAGKKGAKKAPAPAKKTATAAAKAAAVAQTRPSSGRSKPYPARTLEEALAVPKVIREKNNGRPWPTDEVAAALGFSRSNNKFFYLAAASRDYGLTIGSRDSDTIELADLGTDIFFAADEDTARQKKIDAFMSVDIFKKVYDYYGGSRSIPEFSFFSNVLQREFNLDPEFHEEFETIFKANCEFLKIEDGLGVVASDKAKRQEPVSEDIRVVGKAKGKFDRTAFVIMPFSEKGANPRPPRFFDQVLRTIIVPAGNKAGFSVETADKKGSDVIHTTIINRLLEADLVIADLTDHNPNVLCELGIRLAHEKPVALIRAKGTDRIFDVDIIRIEDYDPLLWTTTVEEDVPTIADHIKATWDNRDTMRPYMEILTGKAQSVR